MNWATRNGHLEIVKFLHENRKERCTVDAMNGAAENGHLETVKVLHENRKEGCTADAMDWAAQDGHLKERMYNLCNRSGRVWCMVTWK